MRTSEDAGAGGMICNRQCAIEDLRSGGKETGVSETAARGRADAVFTQRTQRESQRPQSSFASQRGMACCFLRGEPKEAD